MNKLDYTVEPKEHLYFSLKVIFGIIGYILFYFLIAEALSSEEFATFIPLLIYIPFIFLFLFLRLGLLVGYLKGNAIKVSSKQFSDIDSIVKSQSKALGIKNVPDTYILQNGGLLNAFATRFLGSNYIVLYSDVVDEAFKNSYESLQFIIGHELGHIKRNHMLKSLLLFPSFIVPFLNKAYSRASEYTCDNIGASLNPVGSHSGLLILASGRNIWRKVNSEEFMKQENTENGFWPWFAEKISTHPKLTKRVIHLNKTNPIRNLAVKAEPIKVKEMSTSHSDYMPRD